MSQKRKNCYQSPIANKKTLVILSDIYPDDILYHILSFTDVKTKIQLVCKRWNALWKKLSSDEVKRAKEIEETSNYDLDEPIPLFERAAARGSIEATYCLAIALYKRDFDDSICGLLEYSEETLKLLEYAAEKGYIRALLDLGFYYHYESQQKSEQYFYKAGEQGLEMLGNIYFKSIERQDYYKAKEIYLNLSNKNKKPLFFYRLGLIYKRGFWNESKTFERDYAKALTFFSEAEGDDCPKAYYQLGNLLYKEFCNFSPMSHRWGAMEYYLKAAKGGVLKAKLKLVKIISCGSSDSEGRRLNIDRRSMVSLVDDMTKMINSLQDMNEIWNRPGPLYYLEAKFRF